MYSLVICALIGFTLNEFCDALARYWRKTRDRWGMISGIVLVILLCTFFTAWATIGEKPVMFLPLMCLVMLGTRGAWGWPQRWWDRELLPAGLVVATVISRWIYEGDALTAAFKVFLGLALALAIVRCLWKPVPCATNTIRVLIVLGLLIYGGFLGLLLLILFILWLGRSSLDYSLLFPKPMVLKRRQGTAILDCILALFIVGLTTGAAFQQFASYRNFVRSSEEGQLVNVALENTMEEACAQIVAGKEVEAEKAFTVPHVRNSKGKVMVSTQGPLFEVSVDISWGERRRSISRLFYREGQR